VLEIDPDGIRVVRPDSLSSLPSKRSRMAIMLGGAAFHAARREVAALCGAQILSEQCLRQTRARRRMAADGRSGYAYQ
jgi:hypothetical protein